MKQKLLIFILIIIGVAILFAYYFKQYPDNGVASRQRANIDLEKDQILKVAEDTAIKRYGYTLIRNELPFIAKLQNDSIWIVTGTLGANLKGGVVYIEISRYSKKVKKITHYK